MAEVESFDAVVVGASVAGCATATLLGRAGARVALVEQRPDPAAYKTVCTHYIQASATPAIERLGLAEPIEAAGAVRNSTDLWTQHGWIRHRPSERSRFPSYGYSIRREKLDPIMRQLAAETPGVQLRLGERVTGLLRAGTRPAGVRAVDREGREREFRARVVIAADGRDSRVAEMAGSKARSLPHGRFAYFAYYRDLPLVTGETSQIWMLDPDVAYAFVQDDGLTLLAAFQTHDRLPWFKRNLERNFEAFYAGLPDGPRLSGAERVSKIIGKLEMPNTIRRAARPGLAFVGDAALAADPLWGVGCGFALQAADWLADELGPVLAGGSEAQVDGALQRYRKRHRKGLLGHFLLTSDQASARPINGIEHVLYAAAVRDERCAARLTGEYGTRSLRPTDPEFLRLVGRSLRVAGPRPRPRPTPEAARRLTGRHAQGAPLPPSVRSEEITVAGITTPVSSVGDQHSSEAVVFVHGNPGSRRDWDDLLDRVAPSGRAVAFDMPGFGKADKPASFDYTVTGYARFLDAALRELGVERAHLVLHDFGGPWGLEWAAANPDRFASAVLINTGVLPDYRWHYLARIWRTRGVGELFQATTTRSGLRMALRHGNPRGLPRAFVDRMYDDTDAGTNRAILRLYRATDDPSALGRRQAERLRPLNRPALVVWGARDPYIPVAMAQRQREAFPGAEVTILEQSGHWPFADDPDGVGRPVEAFLRRMLTTRSVPAATPG